MILLPASPAPNGFSPRLIDFGITQRPPLGGRVTRIERLGNRFGAEITWPPMKPDLARVFVSRLIAAKSEGLQIPVPLLGVGQSPCGSPVVDGGSQAGKTLSLRGLTPHYAFREGFWLTIFDDVDGDAGAGDGAGYLHNCRSAVAADADGKATIEIETALRWPFGDGATVRLAKPTIEGLPVGGEWSWQLPVDRLIQLSVPIEELG